MFESLTRLNPPGTFVIIIVFKLRKPRSERRVHATFSLACHNKDLGFNWLALLFFRFGRIPLFFTPPSCAPSFSSFR